MEMGSTHFRKLPAADQARIWLLQELAKAKDAAVDARIDSISSSGMTSSLQRTLMECYEPQIAFERE